MELSQPQGVSGDDSDAGLQMQDARAGAGSAASVVVVVDRGSVAHGVKGGLLRPMAMTNSH